MTQLNLSDSIASLPVPDKDALLHSQKLSSVIKQYINEHGGKIGFDRYMSACLYEPGLGYYSAGSRKFGAEGDFITAPEISPLFSRCIANQCAQILNDLEAGIILELGAGTGVMARDILLELEKQGSLPTQYWILEVSADLKQRQQDLINKSLPHLYDRIYWLDSLPVEPFSGLILANEVLDALPVRRFEKADNRFSEIKVCLNEDTLTWTKDQVDADFIQELEQLESRLAEPLPNNYVSEINIELGNWLHALESIISKGVMIFIDYGYTEAEYYHADRNNGSLLCHYRHHVHSDPFFYPGLQDITSSVNFTILAERAYELGLNAIGFTTQTYFLLGCGLDSLIADINAMDNKTHIETMQQVRTLTMPGEMGERFKAMALTKGYDNALSGFSIMDQRIRL